MSWRCSIRRLWRRISLSLWRVSTIVITSTMAPVLPIRRPAQLRCGRRLVTWVCLMRHGQLLVLIRTTMTAIVLRHVRVSLPLRHLSTWRRVRLRRVLVHGLHVSGRQWLRREYVRLDGMRIWSWLLWRFPRRHSGCRAVGEHCVWS